MIEEKLLKEALSLPATAIKYSLSAEVARALEGKSYIETEGWDFNLIEYASHGQCKITIRREPHPLTSWRWSDEGLDETFGVGLVDIDWRGERLQVLKVTWPKDCGEESWHWIIARDQETAKAFLSEVCAFCDEPHGELLVFEDGQWEKSEELYQGVRRASFEALVLAPGLKEELRRDAASFFDAEERYGSYDVPWKRGLLLTGPPGNGKTHMIKCLASSLGKHCLYVRSFKSEHQTDQHNIRQVFARARKVAPCLLVLEDLDSLINDDNRAFFLNELDGFASNHGILTVATTNHPERLDPAIVNRPSRFDRKYAFALPAVAERAAFLDLWSARLRPQLRPSPGALRLAAERTEGFSFAFLKELTLSATMLWAEQAAPSGMDAALASTVDLLAQQVLLGEPGATAPAPPQEG